MIEVGNFIATQNEKGVWLYKAKEFHVPVKKVKAQYKEKPQYKLIEHYENVAKLRFKEELRTTVKEIVTFIKIFNMSYTQQEIKNNILKS